MKGQTSKLPGIITFSCLLVVANSLNAATILFSDTFDSYADGKDDTAFQVAYNVPVAAGSYTVVSSTGLGGSKGLQNTVDSMIVRDDVAGDLSSGAITINLHFQWVSGGGGISGPQIGLVGTFNGGFTGASDIGGRLNNNKLQIRSNNSSIITDDTTQTFTAGSWYQLSTTITRITTTNQLSVLLQLFSSDSSGAITGLMDSISSNITNSNIWIDTTLFAAIRENMNIISLDNFAMTQVPEPRTALLGGLGILALLRRRRQ